jgi:hypothetical protein
MAQAQTSKVYLTFLTLIHSAMFVMQVVFGAVAYFLKSNGMFDSNGEEISDILLIAAPIVAVGGIAASTFVGKMQMRIARQKTDLKEKLFAYRSALLVRLALLEMPTLFILVCYLLTGKILLLGLAAGVLILFYMNRPTINNLAMDLELNPTDRKTIEDPNAIVG